MKIKNLDKDMNKNIELKKKNSESCRESVIENNLKENRSKSFVSKYNSNYSKKFIWF